MSDHYNLFEVLNLTKKETIHSAMIAAIASHDANSQNAFFNMLSKALKRDQQYIKDKKLFDDGLKELRKTIDSCNKEHLWIDNEVHLIEKIKKNGTILKRDRGRADIWIGTNNYHGYDIDFKIAKYRLIIENKINAGPQDFQLRRYYRYLNENGFSREFGGLFLLCIDTNSDNTQKAIKSANSFPNESLLDGNKRPDTQFAIITYKDDIKPWLIEVKNNAQNDDFLKVVSDYLEIVESLN